MRGWGDEVLIKSVLRRNEIPLGWDLEGSPFHFFVFLLAVFRSARPRPDASFRNLSPPAAGRDHRQAPYCNAYNPKIAKTKS
jgi:hypothetical protein